MKKSIGLVLVLGVGIIGNRVQADPFSDIGSLISSGTTIASGVKAIKPAVAGIPKAMQDSTSKIKDLTVKIGAINKDANLSPEDKQTKRQELMGQMVVAIIATFDAFANLVDTIGNKFIVPGLNTFTTLGNIAASSPFNQTALRNALRVTQDGRVTIASLVQEDIQALLDFLNIFKQIMPSLTGTRGIVTPEKIEAAKQEIDKQTKAAASQVVEF
jgi:hypothetical protein